MTADLDAARKAFLANLRQLQDGPDDDIYAAYGHSILSAYDDLLARLRVAEEATGWIGECYALLQARGATTAAVPLVEALRALLDEQQRIRDARRARDEAKAAVTGWMDAEAYELRLRQNSEAPGWDAYVEAERALTAAVNAL